MDEKLVSIITPTYNCGEYIEETILSVKKQIYTNWEMIIVDDCSTDRTQEVVERYKDDKRIKYYKLQNNVGPAMARNKALELAKGYYIAFLDSDDLWAMDKLSTQIKWMKEKNISFSCTDYEQIDEQSKSLGKIIKTRRTVDYNRMLLDCPVGNSTVVYNAGKLGKFKVPNIRKRNDDALWLQILKKEKYIYGINKVLMKYRVRKNSVSSNKLSLVRYHWKLYREIEHLSVFTSLFHIFYWGIIKVMRIK